MYFGWKHYGGCVDDRPSHFCRMKSDIPDWSLDDTASVSDQIVLNCEVSIHIDWQESKGAKKVIAI